jgi:hypothetical protein
MVAEQVIASAVLIVDHPYLGQRALCPLCRDSSSSPYSEGFSVPEGLRRHLTGWGNVRQCRVMQAAAELARDYWHQEFDAVDRDEAADKEAQLKARRLSEILYRVDPNSDPKLIGEGAWFGRTPRSETDLAWAENRLNELGFEFRMDQTKCYVRQDKGMAVFADPRFSSRIDFNVYAIQDATTSAAKPRKSRYVGQFWLMGSWRRDIVAKFESRLLTRL